jgi:hypothetical protein
MAPNFSGKKLTPAEKREKLRAYFGGDPEEDFDYFTDDPEAYESDNESFVGMGRTMPIQDDVSDSEAENDFDAVIMEESDTEDDATSAEVMMEDAELDDESVIDAEDVPALVDDEVVEVINIEDDVDIIILSDDEDKN